MESIPQARLIPFMYGSGSILYWTPARSHTSMKPFRYPPTRSGHGFRLALSPHRRPLAAPAAARLPAGAAIHGQVPGAAPAGEGLDRRLSPAGGGAGVTRDRGWARRHD